MSYSKQRLYFETLDIGSPIDWSHLLDIGPGATLLYSGPSELGEYCDWDMIALHPAETLLIESHEALGAEREILERLEGFVSAPWIDDQGEPIPDELWRSLSLDLNIKLPMAQCALSYELGAQAKGISPRENHHRAPALWAARYHAIYLFQRATKKGRLVASSRTALDQLRAELRGAFTQMAQQTKSSLPHGISNRSTSSGPPTDASVQTHLLTPDVAYPQYSESFERLKESILSGDVYQMNLTIPLSTTRDIQVHPIQLFKKLCSVNAGQFSAYVQIDQERAICSLSPERLARWSGRLGDQEDPSRRTIETAPIKGTRPRKDNPIEDEQERESLLHSEKDAAEHVMILDLERNDLGKLCKSGSIEVIADREARRYATVHHLVSVVRGQLNSTTKLTDILEAIFPGGSVTGAPKLRSMELIRELEPHPRGIYCGALGYIDPLAGGDLNLPIRTLLCAHDKLIYHAGGGVVADSSTLHEWDELWVKTRGVLRALHHLKQI